MKAIKKSLCFALAVLSAAFTARAVDPVAVWVGKDLNGTTQGGITLNLNGNTYGDGAITISGSNGVLLNNANANVCSVIIEYENLNTTANAKQTLFTLQKSGGEDNNIGVYWNTTAKLHGIYKNSSWDNDYAANAIPASGRLCFGYNRGGNGVTVYAGDVTVYDASSLKESGSTYTGVAIGGYRGTDTIGAASNMKITAIAFFTSKLSASEVAAYKFPASSKLYLYTQGTNGGWGGNCNYAKNLNGITLPETAAVPVGTEVEVTKLEIAQAPSGSDANNLPTRIAITVGDKTTTSADFVSGGTIAASGGNNPVKLTYNFPAGCVLTVGTQATIKWLKADGSEITGQIRYAASNDATGRFLSVNNGSGYSPIALLYGREPIALIEKAIDADKTWTALWNGLEPKADEVVALTVSGNPTLTLDKSITCDSVILLGGGNLTIAGNSSADMAKIDCGSFTGKLTYEIDASAGLTADEALKSFIKSASGKVNFVFKSTVQNKGATIDFGNWNGTLGTHLAFIGGAHTFKWQNGSGSGGETKFGANGSVDNPTIWVKNGATLDFYGKDISGWHCAADMNGVLKVDNGARLNLKDNGGTFFFSAKLYLEPGSETHVFTTGQNLRFNGGYDVNKQQLYVPASEGGVAKIVIESNASINIGQENNPNAAAFVGAGSTLRIEGAFGAVNSSRELAKYGEGKLEITGNVSPKLIINAGSIGLGGTVNDLTLANSAAISLDNGAPTITDTFTAQSKQLLLTIAEPTHMMPVVTLPEAADKTGWTAVVNGNTANPCDLVADGNTLKLKWKVPPMITVGADDVTIETADDWNGGVVTIGLGGLKAGDYEDDLRFLLRFGDKTVTGSAANGVATFELGADDFTAGNIYRGTFELEYGEGNPAIVAAEVTVYAGEKTYGTKEGWINETTKTFASTGSYDPEQGATFDDSFIKFSNPTDVVFTPTNSPADYVAKCDSEITFEIFSGEEAIQDDDDTVADDLQAGVKIVDNGTGGVKFQFISGDEWIDGPTATLNTTYAVTVNFHYAKDKTDADSVTYTVKDLTQEPVVANRRANTAEKLETISFADGTQISSLVGKCEIEVAAKGMAPGDAPKIIVAENDEDAQAQANAIPILIPDDEEVKAALDTDEKRNRYKKILKVVAVKDGNQYKATVVLMPAEEEIQKELQEKNDAILVAVAEKLGALLDSGDEGTLTGITGEPGLFYGVAADGNLVSIGMASQDELLDKVDSDNWKIAGSDGTITGLKVTKPANAKQRFYKVICSPTPKSSTK